MTTTAPFPDQPTLEQAPEPPVEPTPDPGPAAPGLAPTPATVAPAAGPLGLYQKLAEVFAELDDVAADKTHENQGWSYASANAVRRAVREPLRQRGVLVLPSTRGNPIERVYKTAAGKERIVTTVALTFTFIDAETGATIACDWLGSGSDDAEKGISKAITVGLRTWLKDTFLLPEADDSGSRRNSSGERLAGEDQLDQIVTAANAAVSDSLTFLNHILTARGITPVTCAEKDANERLLPQMRQLTTSQADKLLTTLRDAATQRQAARP